MGDTLSTWGTVIRRPCSWYTRHPIFSGLFHGQAAVGPGLSVGCWAAVPASLAIAHSQQAQVELPPSLARGSAGVWDAGPQEDVHQPPGERPTICSLLPRLEGGAPGPVFPAQFYEYLPNWWGKGLSRGARGSSDSVQKLTRHPLGESSHTHTISMIYPGSTIQT